MSPEITQNLHQKTRIGINPARGKTSTYRPADVTVALLTYIPSLEGYFENRLDVLKLVFSSLKANTMIPYDLYVFDNGSCAPVTDYLRSLQESDQVDTLILSAQNIGKIGALKILINAAPGRLIAYSDDDILFYPDWLQAHLEVLENFINAGMVSGLPVRNASGHAMQSLENLFGVENGPIQIERKRFIPDEWEFDWALSTGRDPDLHLSETQTQLDLILRTRRVEDGALIEAVGAANHFQFVSPKSIILEALPEEWSGKLMGSMIELDESIDRLGYLRLSTPERYIRHMGNTLSEEILGDAASLGLEVPSRSGITDQTSKTKRGNKHWLLRVPGSRKILHAVYRRLFDVLFK